MLDLGLIMLLVTAAGLGFLSGHKCAKQPTVEECLRRVIEANVGVRMQQLASSETRKKIDDFVREIAQ